MTTATEPPPRGAFTTAVGDLLRRCWEQSPAKTLTAATLMIVSGATLPLAAAALRWLLDAAAAGQRGTAAAAGCVVAALLLAALTLGHFAHVAYFELAELSLVDYDVELIGLANGSPGLEMHEDPERADRLAVLEEEIQNVRLALEALLAAGGLLVGAATTATLLALVHPVLLLLPLVAVPPLLAGRRAERILDRARLAAAAPTRLARNLFQLATRPASAKELRVYGLQDEIRRRHAAQWRSAGAALWSGHLRSGALRALGQLSFAVGYVGAVGLAVREAAAGRQSLGGVVLIIVLAAQVNAQVAQTVSLVPALQRFAAADRRLRELRAAAGDRSPGGDGPPPDRLREGIALRNVSFAYPGTGRPALRDVDLLLPAGSTVAIVGENGAGKTSLVKLLCGLYRPSHGTVTVDGVDLAGLSLDGWRGVVTVGFQDFARYEFVARETIGVGDLPRVTDGDAVTAALARAGAADLPAQLPQGLATRLGTSYAPGTDLSGGQWQKTALGRAMMRRAPLLVILDEPTAALDAEAEHALFERYAAQAARTRAHGAVTVLVSHRFSTVRMADLIVVLDAGTVAEAGDHDALMALGGSYATLYRMQAGAYR
ncbi:ABC transporter ATP-binding protein [Micromonospora sp. WMMD1076]|uniref:ABC transporter ATP-binding protein n=1 Tax=Micromonospora sp. WMMD1076 TaxID=3016103 RepID=UPI00249BEAE1|nr:ABC transporter ATP-binding protein [Micromonospora sp. WMMD1076]WFF05909.1 ABC transporter ATP-binding protein [Micromonospora sp. WMMD1076]